MQIITKRCVIRNFVEGDIKSFSKYRNDADWMQYQNFKCLSEKEYRDSLLVKCNFKNGCQLAIVDQYTNKLIGDLYIRQEGTSFWIGYTISRQFARRGYAFEALKTMIRYIKIIGGTEILADVDRGNIPSINLLEKLNFSLVEKRNGNLIYILSLN